MLFPDLVWMKMNKDVIRNFKTNIYNVTMVNFYYLKKPEKQNNFLIMEWTHFSFVSADRYWNNNNHVINLFDIDLKIQPIYSLFKTKLNSYYKQMVQLLLSLFNDKQPSLILYKDININDWNLTF